MGKGGDEVFSGLVTMNPNFHINCKEAYVTRFAKRDLFDKSMKNELGSHTSPLSLFFHATKKDSTVIFH